MGLQEIVRIFSVLFDKSRFVKILSGFQFAIGKHLVHFRTPCGVFFRKPPSVDHALLTNGLICIEHGSQR